LRRGCVVRLEDAVGLVETDRYTNCEKARDEDEKLAAGSCWAKIV